MAADVSSGAGAWLRHLFLVLKLCFAGVAAAYVLYLVGINLFLSTPLFERAVDARPDTLDVHFDRGWSLRPGRVHARGLSIRGRDGSVEWMLHIGEVRFDIAFRALAHRRFQVTHVRGSGGSFRLRNRLDPWEVTPARVADLPPIEGFPAVPVRPYSQCSLDEWSDEHYRLWTIQLDDVHAEGFGEIWINRNRLEGHTSATGRFYLKPVRAAEVGPLAVELRDERLSVGGERWVDAIDGTAYAALARFDPRTTTGRDLLRQVSLGVETRGVVPDVGALPLPLPRGARLRGAFEMRRLALRFERGRPLRGSRFEGSGSRIAFEQGAHRLSSALAVTAVIQESDERLAFHAIADGARHEHAGDMVLRATRIDVAGTSERPEVGRGIGRSHVTVESADIELPDVRALASYLPPSIELVRGRARGEVWVEAWPDENRARGRASMQAEGLDLHVADIRLRGAATARGSIEAFDWRTGRIERPDVTATVRSRVEVARAGRDAPLGKDFAADIDATLLTREHGPDEGTIDVSGSGVKFRDLVIAGQPGGRSHGEARLDQATLRVDRPRLDGVASVDVTDATPLLASVRERVPWPFRGLLDLPRLTGTAGISVDARRVELSDLEAHGGKLSTYGVFAAGRGDHLGAFVVEGGPLAVGVRIDPGGARFQLFGLSGWLQQEEETVSERFGRTDE
jgi:hypothetical protein